jgi:hypothetical protein
MDVYATVRGDTLVDCQDTPKQYVMEVETEGYKIKTKHLFK